MCSVIQVMSSKSGEGAVLTPHYFLHLSTPKATVVKTPYRAHIGSLFASIVGSTHSRKEQELYQNHDEDCRHS